MSNTDNPDTSLTALLHSWNRGDGQAFGQIFELAYSQLRQIAAQRLQKSGRDVSWSPTELLHEAYLRVADEAIDWRNRAHFFASLSLYIRSVLVDHARARRAVKRGDPDLKVSLTHSGASEESMVADVLALEQALVTLSFLDARCAEVIHLNYFAGLDRAHIAEVLNLSVASVDRDLRFARAWLKEQLASA